MNVKENNKLIAEFMGADRIPHDHMGMYRYNYDWNSIMGVVGHIEDLGFTTSFKTRYCRINPQCGGYENFISRVSFNEDGHTVKRYIEEEGETMLGFGERISKLEAVYIAVVEFVKWYNQNK